MDDSYRSSLYLILDITKKVKEILVERNYLPPSVQHKDGISRAFRQRPVPLLRLAAVYPQPACTDTTPSSILGR